MPNRRDRKVLSGGWVLTKSPATGDRRVLSRGKLIAHRSGAPPRLPCSAWKGVADCSVLIAA